MNIFRFSLFCFSNDGSFSWIDCSSRCLKDDIRFSLPSFRSFENYLSRISKYRLNIKIFKETKYSYLKY